MKEHGGETPGKVILSKEPEIEVCLHMDVVTSPIEFYKKFSYKLAIIVCYGQKQCHASFFVQIVYASRP